MLTNLLSLARGIAFSLLFIPLSLLAANDPQDSSAIEDLRTSYSLRVEKLNAMKEGTSKSRLLAQILDELSTADEDLERYVLSQIDVSSVSKRDVLNIGAQSTRRLMSYFQNEDLDSCANHHQHNPYALFNLSVVAYQYSRNERTYDYLLSAIDDFTTLRDTAFLLSAYNNMAAYFWQANELDSAVVYFSKAKKIASWHPLMIDVNLINLAVILNDTALAQAEISFLHGQRKNMQPFEEQLYTRNAFSYYKVIRDESACDSILNQIMEVYGTIDSLPNPLLAIPIFQESQLQAIAQRIEQGRFDSINSNLDVVMLQTNPNTWSQWSKEALMALSASSADTVRSSVLALIAEGPEANHEKLVRIYKAYINLSEHGTKRQGDEQTKALLDEQYSLLVVEQEKAVKASKAFYLGIALLLILCLFAYRYSVKARSARKAANRRLEELSQKRLELHDKIIQEFLSIKSEIKAFHTLKKDRTKDDSIAVDMISHVKRFELQQYFNHYDFSTVQFLQEHLSPGEYEMLQLKILGLKNKEMAIVLDKSMQHIHNTISVLRKKLADQGIVDFTSFIARSQNEVFNNTYL